MTYEKLDKANELERDIRYYQRSIKELEQVKLKVSLKNEDYILPNEISTQLSFRVENVEASYNKKRFLDFITTEIEIKTLELNDFVREFENL